MPQTRVPNMGVGARNVEGWLVACARPHQKKRKKIPTPKKKDKKNKAHKATGGNIRRVNPRNSQVQQQKKSKKKDNKSRGSHLGRLRCGWETGRRKKKSVYYIY
jgi:hypothetical protein